MSLYLTIIIVVMQLYAGIMGLNIIFSWFPNIYRYRLCRIIDIAANWYLKPFHGIVVIGSIDFTTMIGLGFFQFVIGLIYLI